MILKKAAQDLGGTTPRTYPKHFILRFLLCADAERNFFNHAKDWVLAIEFYCHNLLQIMQEGLFWITSNVVPARVWIGRTPPTGTLFQTHGWERVWELSESVGKPGSECRWVATVTLYGHSVDAMPNFRLGTMCRQNISSIFATDSDGHIVFEYARPFG